jgi:DHA2 family multidrug resistance protein
MDSAAGLMNFLRTISGAFATSLVNTVWENQTNYKHEQLSVLIDSSGTCFRNLIDSGMSAETARSIIDQLATSQSVMLATNDIMLYSSVAFAIAAFAIWFGPSTRKH